MFGFHYVKAPPTHHVMHFRNGQVVRQGIGKSFFCFGPISTIVQIPLASTGVPFVFEEVTADFQELTIQGDLTYRTVDVAKISKMLDFRIDRNGRYLSDDPSQIAERLTHAAQTAARGFAQSSTLREALISGDPLAKRILEIVGVAPQVAMLGIEVLDVNVHSLRPSPEMAKALQAEARELLLQKADEAVFARRNTAIELERQIKENELNTEVAVEQKRRQVRQTKLEADISLEQQRTELVDKEIENQTKENQAKAESLRAMLEPIKNVDWRVLMATQSGGLDSRQMIAMAFRDLADNASKVGTLNISPDLLQSLLMERGETEPNFPAQRSQRNR